MNSKKLNFNWQSFVLGIVLCAVLVVFIGSKAADPQSSSMMQRNMQRQVNLMDLWEKTSALDARVIAMDERLIAMDARLIRVEQNTADLLKEMRYVTKSLARLEARK